MTAVTQDDGSVVLRQCSFMIRNPVNGNAMRHPLSPREPLVMRLIPLIDLDGRWNGDMVEVWVCQGHAETMDQQYNAVPHGPLT